MSFSLNQLFFFSIPVKHKLHFKNIHLGDEHNLVMKLLKPKHNALVLCHTAPGKHCWEKGVIKEASPAQWLHILRMFSARSQGLDSRLSYLLITNAYEANFAMVIWTSKQLYAADVVNIVHKPWYHKCKGWWGFQPVFLQHQQSLLQFIFSSRCLCCHHPMW